MRPRLSKWARSRGPEAAHRFLRINDPVSAARIPIANLKYMLRALEVLLSTGSAASTRDASGDRWADQFRRLLESGLSRDSNSFQAIGYREVAEWVLGRISRDEAELEIVSATRRLAKRQSTWFAREREIRWSSPEEGVAAALALFSGEATEETR